MLLQSHTVRCGESIKSAIAERPSTSTRRTRHSRPAGTQKSLPGIYTHVAAANATTPPSRDTFCSSFSAMLPSSLPLQKLEQGCYPRFSVCVCARAPCCRKLLLWRANRLEKLQEEAVLIPPRCCRLLNKSRCALDVVCVVCAVSRAAAVSACSLCSSHRGHAL